MCLCTSKSATRKKINMSASLLQDLQHCLTGMSCQIFHRNSLNICIYIYIHICFFLLKIALACDACLLPRSSANLNIQHQERYSWWEVLHMNHRKFFFCRWKQNQYSCGCFPKIGVVVFTPQIKIHLFIGF